MSHATSSSALLDGRTVAHALFARGHKTALLGFLWLLGSLVTAATILGIIFAISAQKQREAGRMIVVGQKGTSYLSLVTHAMAESRGQPNGF